MKRIIQVTGVLLVVTAVAYAQDVPELMNYQGTLIDVDDTVVSTGDYTLEFCVYDQAEAGKLVWGPQVFDGQAGTGHGNQVHVVVGNFNVILGPEDTEGRLLKDAFDAAARYLEIAFRNPDSGVLQTLTPRQQVLSGPFALKAGNAATAGYATEAGNAATASYATEAGNAMTADSAAQAGNAATAGYATEAGNADTLDQLNSTDFAPASHDHDSSYWSLTGNSGTVPGTHFLGTTDAPVLELRVNSTPALRLELYSTSPNIIGGHNTNSVLPGVYGATTGGGGQPATPNRITDHFGTIGGGGGNQAGDGDDGEPTDAFYATVGGGLYNTALASYCTVAGGDTNTASASYGTVGGGSGNHVTATGATVSGGGQHSAGGEWATVGGGSGNTANGSRAVVSGGQNNLAGGDYATIGGGSVSSAGGSYATVGGGSENNASGSYATVPGGVRNRATGSYSLAAGRRAYANDTGSFVWGDSTDANILSPGNNTFSVRASGGIWLGTTSSPSTPPGRFINTSTDAHLTSGGMWVNASDRNKKENIRPVDQRQVLLKLAQVPITTWNYTADKRSRHMGPMAQELYAAFELGDTDKSIGTIDANGVALAAIQGLHQIVQEKDEQLSELRDEVNALKVLVEKLAHE